MTVDEVSTLPAQAQSSRYACVLTRDEIDRFEHNKLFTRELTAAFAATIDLRPFDYIKQPRLVFEALQDKDCAFFVCFNGFGSELLLPTSSPARLMPAYAAFDKPLFDIMHDCPAHESMAHQLRSTFKQRTLLITDYTYAAIASRLGVADVLYVPSITFPETLLAQPHPQARSIDVLLPVSLVPPHLAEKRFSELAHGKQRVYRALFHEASAIAIANWQSDPLTELVKAASDVGLCLDWQQPDHRFLLTTTTDFVKFSRRDRLVRALRGLPVTIMTDRATEFEADASKLTFVPGRPASEMLRLMRESRAVLSPAPHLTGFHERSLGALGAGAALLSSPNKVLEADFMHGRDLVFWRSEQEAASVVERLLADPALLETIGENGRVRVADLYSPARLVQTILSRMRLTSGAPIG